MFGRFTNELIIIAASIIILIVLSSYMNKQQENFYVPYGSNYNYGYYNRYYPNYSLNYYGNYPYWSLPCMNTLLDGTRCFNNSWFGAWPYY